MAPKYRGLLPLQKMTATRTALPLTQPYYRCVRIRPAVAQRPLPAKMKPVAHSLILRSRPVSIVQPIMVRVSSTYHWVVLAGQMRPCEMRSIALPWPVSSLWFPPGTKATAPRPNSIRITLARLPRHWLRAAMDWLSFPRQSTIKT